MPRAGQPPASTLRNRNRITNKTRLRVFRGNVDADPIIPDEDEEKNRLHAASHGVDLEDANEHHLQAVLTEAASKNHVEQTAAFIPIPEATGLADNYESLYPTDRWKDPVSYVQSTAVIEEYTSAGLADGSTYYMDERDKEWLDRNNEEARGEGTSAQGSLLTSTGRTSARSAKAKGKEPEDAHPILMSEDEFELVMGLFEKITQEKTEFLHHSLESGQNHFPEFSEYQQVFSVPLPPATFASYSPPSWLPQPSHLLRISRVIYPYWKERCLERAGHRIIPRLNFDEADTLNESYVCFRRRETKAVRKTRASQITSSDKLARLQTELEFPLQLAKQLLAREQLKRDSARQSQVVWDLRMKLVEMKVKNPTLGDKTDDELLVDRERKNPSRVRIPVKTDPAAQPSTPARDILRPKDRQALYQSKTDALLQDLKEKDQSWDDHVDTGYVSTLQPYSSRLFKYISPPERLKRSSPNSESDAEPAPKRPIRVRCGRGGRMFVDRRLPVSHTNFVPRRRILGSDDEDDPMDVDTVEDPEADRRLSERWRFDSDDNPPYGPSGSEEQDRVLIDDYDVKYMSRVVTLLGESDYSALLTDHTISRITTDGKRELITPFRLGMMTPMMKAGSTRGYPPQGAAQGATPVSQQVHAGAPNGTHAAMPHQGLPISQQLKLPSTAPTPGASGSGVVHTPSPVPAPAAPNTHSSSPPVIPSPQVTHNGVGRAAMNMPRVDMMKLMFNSNAGPAFPQKTESVPQAADGHSQLEEQQIPRPNSRQQIPMQPHQQDQAQAQAQAQALASVNGLHPGYAALANANPAAYNISHYIPHPYSTNPVIPSGLNTQQVQHLKSVFNAANAGSAQNYNAGLFAQMQMPKNTSAAVNGTSVTVPSSNGSPHLAPAMNLKLPPVRQMQQRAANDNSPPRPTSAVNGVQQHNSPSPHMMHAMVPGEHVPARTPSANGSRTGFRPPVANNGMQGAQMGHGQVQQQQQMMMNGQVQQQMLQLHSQSPKPAYNSPQSYSLSPSPPKMQPASNIPVGSPLLQQQQQQQVVGNSQGVY